MRLMRALSSAFYVLLLEALSLFPLTAISTKKHVSGLNICVNLSWSKHGHLFLDLGKLDLPLTY